MPHSDFRTEDGHTCCAQRWLLAYMGLWLGIMTYMLNSNMSIAVVCMAKSRTESDANRNVTSVYEIQNNSLPLFTRPRSPVMAHNVSFESEDSVDRCDRTEEVFSYSTKKAEFDWDKKTRSFVLSGYYYGYMVTQIPGGWLASAFGGKHVIGTFMAISSALTLLIPVLARTSVYLLIVDRALIGLSMGMVLPGYCGLVGIWALPTERSRFMAFCWFGQMVGAMLGYSTSGLLCVHGFDNGWPSIFYVHGMIGALFVLTWWFTIYDSPQKHPRITERERKLLLTQSHNRTARSKKKTHIPWKRLFTYLPIYAMFITHTCDNWTHYLILTCLPQFFKEVLKVNIESNGLFSCLPFASLMVGIAFAGMCADFIRKKDCFTVTTIRKLFQLVALFGETVFILIPGYLACDQIGIAIMCLCLCTLFQGAGVTGGYTCNAIDIAPRYASMIFAVSNTIASIPGILAPLAVAEITKNQTSEEWRVIFYLCAGVSVFAALVYGVFGNSELATWANINADTELEVYEIKQSSIKNRNLSKPSTVEKLISDSVLSKESEIIMEFDSF